MVAFSVIPIIPPVIPTEVEESHLIVMWRFFDFAQNDG